MRTVAAIAGKAHPLDLGVQPVDIEDAHMATGNLVVLPAQPPADALRPGPRHADTEQPTGLQHPAHFRQSTPVVGQVLQHLGTDHPVKTGIGKGQRQGTALDKVELTPVRRRGELRRTLSGRAQVRQAEIETHGMHLALEPGADAVAPLPAAQVENAVTGAQGQEAEINGLHVGSHAGTAPPCPGHTRSS